MNVLSVDTSTNTLHLALKSSNGFEERVLSLPMQHSERLLMEIKELVSRQGLKLDDLDLLVCTRGPGAFTSLRIGMSCLKGISVALDKPMVSVPTLKALALSSGASDQAILTVIDARKKRFYLGLYDSDGNALMDDIDGNAENLVDKLSAYSTIYATGPDAKVFAEKLILLLKEDQKLIVDRNEVRPLGLVLIEMGIKQFEEVGADDIGQGPSYIRRSDAEEALLERLKGEEK
ncbi:MAG: tRNA (adenosine(37)-N6)-threonylcarbamoyltransferase complex dimerization subunit type 1 TsaB [Sphaerochaetaceae bacterium]|nr:tRNA (adenosine(37)-N6)-threonylcarbamoyltransferase complex dimerization subunit type 1 TsaB [Sphaerochaetaceae bacterium]